MTFDQLNQPMKKYQSILMGSTSYSIYINVGYFSLGEWDGISSVFFLQHMKLVLIIHHPFSNWCATQNAVWIFVFSSLFGAWWSHLQICSVIWGVLQTQPPCFRFMFDCLGYFFPNRIPFSSHGALVIAAAAAARWRSWFFGGSE